MSYNTRRNAGAGVPSSPQVSYHQAPSNQQRGQQRQVPPNVGYASHFSNPVPYSNQPGFGTPQAKPQDEQQKQQAAAAALVSPAAAALAALQQQPPGPPPPPPATPATPDVEKNAAAVEPVKTVKMEEDSTTNGGAATTESATAEPSTTTSNSNSSTKPVWMKKGLKVNKVIKRRRQNARLRKMLVPKNALMAINEIHPGPKFDVQEHTNALNQTIYSVRVEIDGKVHSGQSVNKTHAKQMACENALKNILVTRMQAQLSDSRNSSTPMQEDSADGGSEMDDDASSVRGGGPGGFARPPEDDMPWGCLASFALHKLFLEWQNQGVEIPITVSTPNIKKVNLTSPTQPIKKMPEDAHKRHPVLMLNHLQPGLQYQERIEGIMPNAIFIFSVTIDGQKFTGSATTKKEAKKECAKAALVKFGIHSEY